MIRFAKRISSALFATSFLVLLTPTGYAQDGNRARVNLGPNINTPDATECHPVLSPTGRVLYFKREVPGRDYDIYRSVMDENRQWQPAQEIPELNNEFRNEVEYAYPDGNRLILSGTYEGKKGFFVTDFNGMIWSAPRPMPFENEPASWDNQNATLSSNGRVMIISNNADLYVCFLKSSDVWSEPVPITSLNTTSYEYTPFLAPDDKTLYFSGNGYPTMGLNDILKTKRLDDTWLNWSTPEDLDNTINSSDWESYFTMSAKGDDAYVYSLKEGKGDLFRVPLAEATKPLPVALVSGTVINANSKQPLAAEITYDLIDANQNAGIAKTNATDGNYSVVLQYGRKYSLAARAPNYYALSDVLDLTTVNTYQEIHKDILMYPMDVGQTVRLNNLFFETNKSDIKPESFTELERLVTILNTNPALYIQIGGHTDNIGSVEYNIKLSQDRVNAVIAYLKSNGIVAERLTGKGFGKSVPLTTNDTEEGRSMNRRVEFTIVKH